jgi:hypothetical protein
MLILINNPGFQLPNDRHFINSHSLKSLYISECNITSVSVETFANVTALEVLDLRHNNLRSLDINILKVLPKLSAMYLYDNPLQCDCQLQELWRWCQDHEIQTVYEGKGTHCVIPNQENSLPWVVLDEHLFLQDNIENLSDYDHKIYKRAEGNTWLACKTFWYHMEKLLFLLNAISVTFGMTSNTIILIIIRLNKDMRTLPNMYILNLATSDMILITLFVFVTSPDEVYANLYYPDIFRAFGTFFYCLSVSLSGFTLTLLNILRYRVTANPISVCFPPQMTWCAALAKVRKVWIAAFAFALTTTVCIAFIPKYDTILYVTYYKYVCYFVLLVSCAIPVCVMTISCATFTWHYMERVFISEGKQQPQMNKITTTQKVVWALSVVFIISYGPYYLFITYSFMNMTDEFSVTFYSMLSINELSVCFLLMYSCLNPVVVFSLDRVFRKHLKRYLTRCCKTNSPPTNLELVRRF